MIKINVKKWFKRDSWKRLARLINPAPKIGGLEVTDSALRYVFLEGGKIKKASLRLPAGLVKDGQIRNKPNFIAALKELRKQITRSRKPLNIILVVSPAAVYTQLFNLPIVAKGKINEAARLNLEMISPIDIDKSYYDWEMVGEESIKEGNFDLFGAFADAAVIDAFTSALLEAGFAAAAIESAPMALARTLRSLLGKQSVTPYVAFNLTSDGLDFFVLRNGKLYFNYYLSWLSIREREGTDNVTLASIKKIVTIELQRLMNFYTSKWGGVIEDLILVSAMANKELVTTIQSTFRLKVHSPPLAKSTGLDINWGATFGAALRGLVPRDEDNFISLASVGTEERFQQSRILIFSIFWRNIVMAVAVGLLAIYGLFDIALATNMSSLRQRLEAGPTAGNSEEAVRLQKSANDFNILVDKSLLARSQSIVWSPLFSRLQSLAAVRDVRLTQIKVSLDGLTISMSGSANNERVALNFKSDLIKQENFADVSLPLTSIRVNSAGQAGFTVSFRLKKWPIE